MDIGYAMNYQHVCEIDATPQDGAPTWAWFGPGIKSISADKSETTSEEYFFDGGGQAETSVDAIARAYNVSGYRRPGDPAQDFVAGLDEETGDALLTKIRMTGPTGEMVERDVTVHEIKASDPTGDANVKTEFSCKLSCKGSPRLVEESAGTDLPDSVTAQAVTVAVGGTSAIGASVSPATASQRVLCAVLDPKVAEVTTDGLVTGLKAGKTTVTVKAAAKPSVMAQVEVTVTAGAQAAKA